MGRKGLKTRASAPTPEKKKEEETLKEEVEEKQREEEDKQRGTARPATLSLEEEAEEQTMEETEDEEGTDTPKEEEEEEVIVPVEALEKLGEVFTKDRPPKTHAHYNTAPLNIDPWRGGRGYKEFKQEFESKSAGSAWSDEMKVTRLAGHLRGLVAARYRDWLDKGTLKGKPMSEVWRMIEKDMVNIEEENELDKEEWEQRLQKKTETVQEFYEIFMDGASRADVPQGRALTSRFVKNLKEEIGTIMRPALTANPELPLATLVQMARQAEGRPSGKTQRSRKREWEDYDEDPHVATINALARELSEVKGRLSASEAEAGRTRATINDHAKERRPHWAETKESEGRDTTQVVMSQMLEQMSKMAKELASIKRDNQPRPTPNRGRGGGGGGFQGKCYKCDELGHSARECTKTVQCSFCHKPGHVESNCWSKPGATGPSKRMRIDGGGRRPIQPSVDEVRTSGGDHEEEGRTTNVIPNKSQVAYVTMLNELVVGEEKMEEERVEEEKVEEEKVEEEKVEEGKVEEEKMEENEVTVRGRSPIAENEESVHGVTEEVSEYVELVAKRYSGMGTTSLISVLTQRGGEQEGLEVHSEESPGRSNIPEMLSCHECDRELSSVCLDEVLMPVLATVRQSGKGTAGDRSDTETNGYCNPFKELQSWVGKVLENAGDTQDMSQEYKPPPTKEREVKQSGETAIAEHESPKRSNLEGRVCPNKAVVDKSPGEIMGDGCQEEASISNEVAEDPSTRCDEVSEEMTLNQISTWEQQTVEEFEQVHDSFVDDVGLEITTLKYKTRTMEEMTT